MPFTQEPLFRRGLIAGLLVGVAGAALVAGLGLSRVPLLWRACFLAWFACWPIAMGGLGMLALANLTGGRWALACRPFYLAAGQTLPALAVFSIPLAFGLDQIYPWAGTGPDDALHFSPAKADYLSPPFFLARAAAYFVVWMLVGWWLGLVSRLDRPPASRPAMRRAGALSLVLLVPTATFAAFDWGMSLEPHWYSSIYGAIITAGGAVAVHALASVGVALVLPATRRAFMIDRPHREHEPSHAELLNDLGNLLLAFIMLWTYFSFSQFLIIWSGDQPSEIAWYQRRLYGAWGIVAVIMLTICFALPFLLLLSRNLKRRSTLAAIASLLVVGYLLNMYWTIVPAFPPVDSAGHVACILAMVAGGGLWLALCSWNASRLGTRRPRPRELAE
jgi:hypothetical protein